MGFNSTLKDGCKSLRGAANKKLKVPNAPTNSMLHVSCTAHNHMKANNTKSHLQDTRKIQDIRMDLNKIDHDINIGRVAKEVCGKMLTKWHRQYREPEFDAKMTTYFSTTGHTTP